MNHTTEKYCSSCSQLFACESASGKCWCMDYPAVLSVEENNDCLCYVCLKQKIKLEITNYVATITPETALQNKVKDLPETTGLMEDIDYYIENGLYVFTGWYHLKRGHCCNNGCRHCPYGFKK